MNVSARRLGLPVIGYEARSGRQHPTRPLTLPKRVRASERRELELVEYPEDGPARPVKRGDCYRLPRPCPFASCRYHLYLDVNKSGTLRVNFPDRDATEVPATCTLDLAAVGKLSLEHVAYVMNLTRERVRQLEGIALRKLAEAKGWPP